MAVRLTNHIRALRGGSQPRLMEANDGNLYVVKFQGNPQGTSVLTNELLAAKIAVRLGLPVPTTAVVELPPELSEGLYFETPNGRQPIRPGLHVGSRLVVTGLEGRRYDHLPRSFRHLIKNPKDLVGIQLFDLWTCNRDEREFVIWKYSREKKYTVSFIDNGHCFGGPEWSFVPMVLPKSTLIEPSAIEAWRHWADRIGNFPLRSDSMVTGLIPPEWCDGLRHFSVIFEELQIRQAIIARKLCPS
jgi:HipA-like protein